MQTSGLRLSLRRIFIVPTALGWLWAAVGGLLYVVGVNTSSNVPLILGFLMLALQLLAIFLTAQTLHGLQLNWSTQLEGWAGEQLPLMLQLTVPKGMRYLGLQLGPKGRRWEGICVAGMQQIPVPWQGESRGLNKLPRLRIDSQAPLGLWVCWVRLQLATEALLYPAPVVAAVVEVPWPQAIGTQQPKQSAEPHDFHSLQPHRPEEGPQRLAWKQLARGHGELSKRFEAPTAKAVLLSLQPGIEKEKGLSAIAARIKQLASNGDSYGLLIDHVEIPPANGSEHRRICLRRLALLP
ncbi:DUF58 domain-containing protein [Synechococcus sp. UW140]|uniref:DUF58 domain-containing protein n=1 Tax=Synechococcus sp. UW140 TaxID=368503 RepID=UPI0025E101FE|nr:DUF58 domain-containing protein [Synechococcus sp. UW140]